MAAPAHHPRSLTDEAYHLIREDILRGQLKPGTPLSRRRLASALHMSVAPITDALHRLEQDGLVETRSRAGTRVRVPTAKDVREVYELREALETQSARLFAKRASAMEKMEIRRLAEQVDTLFNQLVVGVEDDPGFKYAVHSQHVRLHMWIAEVAGSRLLTQMIEQNHVLILNWLFDVTGRRTPLPDDFHARLAEALCMNSEQRADAAMRSHVRYGFNEISGQISALSGSEWRERRGQERKVGAL